MTAAQVKALRELAGARDGELGSAVWNASSTTVNRLRALGYVEKYVVEAVPSLRLGRMTVNRITCAGRAALGMKP